jgi:outer membrane receptor protein involved in Fe transport
MTISRRLHILVLAVLCGAAGSFAGNTGKISGVVRDSRTKEPIPGVNVVVQGKNLGAASDVEGRYVILNIPPGRYKVVATYIGYRRFEINDLNIAVDFTTQLDIGLVEGSVEMDAIVVQGERSPLIRQDLTNPVASISSESIDALPVTDISEVIGLQAGVVVDDDGSLHIRGGYGNEILYTLNGLNINNPYGNSRSVGVATNAVQEVSVSSGTFSAEYGGALSGVVNYVTKDGGPRWTGNLRYLTGGQLTDQDNLYYNINSGGKFHPWRVNRTEASFGGPLLGEDLTLFASGVYNWNGGSLFAERKYLPTDSYLSAESFPSGDPRRGASTNPYYFGPAVHDTSLLVGLPGGDGAIVPLNWSMGYNVQGNLSYRLSPSMKLKYEFINDHEQSPVGTARSHRYMPDGRALYSRTGYSHSLDFTHSVNERVFYTLKGSYTTETSSSRLYEDPTDSRYVPSFYAKTFPNTDYLVGGDNVDWFWQKSNTITGKLDLVAQALANHEVKAGLEVRSFTVRATSFTLLFEDPNDPNADPSFTNMLQNGNTFLPKVPTATGGYLEYEHHPLQFSAYLQDKIELFTSIILNMGVRYEYFNADAPYNPGLTQEMTYQDTIFLQDNLTPATPKHMVSPRISVSYPITDQGTIRFSYGHFYQIGSLSSLYTNPNFRAPLGTTPTFGNPNVNPQRSIQYELGLQQGLTENLRVELTAYYKDVRDYIYSQQVITPRGDKSYYLLTNLAYANTRGISLSLLKRRSPGDIFSASLDYTFQVSEGNRTEPLDEIFYNEQAGELSETYLVPLGFDRSHTLTSTITLSQPGDWLVSMIGFARTGTPYTPAFPSNVVPITFVQNSDRQPVQWNVDLKLEKYFTMFGIDYSIFLQVDNLFDRQNELTVYANSGQALYSIDETNNPALFTDLRRRISRNDPGMIPMNAVDSYYANPGNVSSPRLVRFGASVTF